ncbi:MAG: hypothetical protein JWQ71_4126 [Pedosphaera sp.]|nr:hypothetical protein [Pedosphaera sp.]
MNQLNPVGENGGAVVLATVIFTGSSSKSQHFSSKTSMKLSGGEGRNRTTTVDTENSSELFTRPHGVTLGCRLKVQSLGNSLQSGKELMFLPAFYSHFAQFRSNSSTWEFSLPVSVKEVSLSTAAASPVFSSLPFSVTEPSATCTQA